jgi:diguanylate cyclase (GGDEF)-like protein
MTRKPRPKEDPGSKYADLGLDDILDCALEGIRRSFEGDRVQVMVYDANAMILIVHGDKGDASLKREPVRVPLAELVGGRSLREGRVVHLSEASPESEGGKYPLNCGEARRLAAIPMGEWDDLIGVVLVERELASSDFSDRELAFLRAFAAETTLAIRNNQVREMCERHLVNLSIVQELGNLLVSTLDSEKLLDSLATYVADVLSVDDSAIWDANGSLGMLTVKAYRGREPVGPRDIQIGQGSVGWVAQNRKELILTSKDPRFNPALELWPKTEHLMLAPIEAKGNLLGVLHLARRDLDKPFEREDLELLLLFAVQAGVALENVRLYSQVEHLATTDPLTGLANRRSFQDSLESEIDRAARYGDSLALLMMDIDHFKLINDSYGHTVGDQVLRNLGRVFHANVRRHDLPCRIGGEEFAVIAPNATKDKALLLARRLLEAVRTTDLFDSKIQREVTISIGLASYPEDARSMDNLIKSADDVLYEAKRNGRNTICVA